MRSLLLRVVATALITASLAAPSAHAATTCPANPAGLANGGFESPVVAGAGAYRSPEQAGWQTTDSGNAIEFWSIGPGTAESGDQFIELNAFSMGVVHQDFATVPGMLLHWRLAHRERALSGEAMRVFLGPPGTAGGQGLTEQAPLLHDGAAVAPGTRDILDSGSAWHIWEGEYTVPPGQTTTRFAMADTFFADAVPSLTGFLGGGFGNFVDSVSIAPYATACADTAVTEYGRPVSIDLLANDLGTGLQATPRADAAHGTVTAGQATGQVLYQPAPGFSGTDSFSYDLAGDFGRTDHASVTVTVGAAPSGDSTSTPPPPPPAVTGRCASRRTVTLHWRVPRGARVKATDITLNGRRLARLRGRARAYSIKLAGLPRGAVKVQVTARTADGARLSSHRTYRLCTAKRAGPGLSTLRLRPQRSS